MLNDGENPLSFDRRSTCWPTWLPGLIALGQLWAALLALRLAFRED